MFNLISNKNLETDLNSNCPKNILGRKKSNLESTIRRVCKHARGTELQTRAFCHIDQQWLSIYMETSNI